MEMSLHRRWGRGNYPMSFKSFLLKELDNISVYELEEEKKCWPEKTFLDEFIRIKMRKEIYNLWG